MPEGPSIVILKEEALVFMGKKVVRTAGNTKVDVSRIKGRKILDLNSWGKHFLICFDDFFIRIHLMMFGSYRINDQKDSPVRLSFVFSKGELNFYNCSVKIIDSQAGDHYDWASDTMSGEWAGDKAFRSLRGSPGSMVCDVLLDQNVFSGVGNIIKNEVLFITHIHPEAIVRDLPVKKLRELIEVTWNYCFDFYKWKKIYELKKHWQIYRKSICSRCNIRLNIRYSGKTHRKTYFCENCQFSNRAAF